MTDEEIKEYLEKQEIDMILNNLEWQKGIILMCFVSIIDVEMPNLPPLVDCVALYMLW